MATIKRIEDIQTWLKARELVREDGPLKRDFGLKDQLCRAAVSSRSNIAEGFARNTDKDFAHFLDAAKGSAAEVQSLLWLWTSATLGAMNSRDCTEWLRVRPR